LQKIIALVDSMSRSLHLQFEPSSTDIDVWVTNHCDFQTFNETLDPNIVIELLSVRSKKERKCLTSTQNDSFQIRIGISFPFQTSTKILKKNFSI